MEKVVVTVVIVLYNTTIGKSKTINSIKAISNNYDFSNFRFVIYDNGSHSQEFHLLPLETNYHHDEHNGGLVTAYDYALNYCNEKKIQWLLLLDQDTELTKEYFYEIENTLATVTKDNDVAAVLPRIMSHKKNISPVVMKTGGFIGDIDKNIYGICDFPVTGINSGTLLKTDFINSRGGFNPVFKIDMLDYWYFKMIYSNNKKVYIMKEFLEHDLSVMNYDNVTIERYENIIKAELAFFGNYCSKKDLRVFKLRLLLRLLKQLLKVRNKKIAGITLRYLFGKNG